MPVLLARYIHVKGLVQGVGFRPFIYRLAIENQVNGWVANGTDGVRIHVEGLKDRIDSFLAGIALSAPEASLIQSIEISDAVLENHTGFSITNSQDLSGEITEISPDIAVCQACLEDMKLQPHRLGYPFINCTNCGPRFTIIRDLPYDRAKTTMSQFHLCPVCHKEYTDILDRRFHAQPVACNECGPHYELLVKGQRIKGTAHVVEKTARYIDDGLIVAIKGMGGYHLACDALNEIAVSTLRSRKNREGKPFAVMFRDISSAREFLQIEETEEKALLSWRRPIVILRNKTGGKSLARSVSNSFSTTGVMLPFMPIHYLLFEKLRTPAIVLTSGNLSDEPIIIQNAEAEKYLPRIADCILSYNRDIFNRTDDSVTMVVSGQPRLIRRSRGYVPSPHHLELDTEGIFAAGAELVNCFCIGKGRQAIMSQHIGDLQNLETLDFYTESFGRFRKMFRTGIDMAVCDLHPDYLSSRFAGEYCRDNGNLPIVKVQHHHAHIASCMAENNLDGPVIGISMDGVGLGTDGKIWGFEVMQADLLDFKRLSHLDYTGQPGGDAATHEPWRMALAYLIKYSGEDLGLEGLKMNELIETAKIDLVRKAIGLGINCPQTSSAGRLFDAVAALSGICLHSSFHAEAPMRLEDIIDESITGQYEIGTGEVIDPGEMIRQIIKDIRAGLSPALVSTKFHRALVRAVADSAEFGRKLTGIQKVALSGGVFQNRYLLSNSIRELQNRNFEVFTQKHFPSNDGGIALGQLAIAAKRRMMNYNYL